MQRTSPNTEDESTPDAILNVAGPSSSRGKTIELSATFGESVIDIPQFYKILNFCHYSLV
jgi:hypothetical protein